MNLAARLSAFFLVALAVVLVGFSATLYSLASVHLYRSLDDRLDAALATMAAVAENGPGGYEWEPDLRELTLGRDAGPDQIRWAVRDERGVLVDRSRNLDPKRLSPDVPPEFKGGRLPGRDGLAWQSRMRRLAAPAPTGSSDYASGLDRTGLPDEDRVGPTYSVLNLVAFVPLGPTEATLRRLGFTLVLLSTGVWLVAAVAGRRLCRQALAPLTRMSSAARDAEAAEPGHRLPLPGTNDELQDLGHAFNGLLDRLHHALERQRRFAGDASHQLRTPLTVMLGQVDVALRRARSLEEYERVLGVVHNQADHLRQIVESLLFLARTESDSERPELDLVDLTTWVPDHLRTWSTDPRSADLQLVDEGQGSLFVKVQPALMSQLVDNLLDNACKYSRPGTPIVVRIGRRRERGVVVLSLEDQGCGISADELGQLFEPFYRSPQARRRGQSGVGLGLAVAQRIVSALEGSITVESEPGVGSRFEIQLPERPTPIESNSVAPTPLLAHHLPE